MTLSKALTATFVLSSLALLSTSAHAKEKAKLPDLVKTCKKDCPDAKNNNEAHECAEDKAKADGEKFKKSKCWIENEKYETMAHG